MYYLENISSLMYKKWDVDTVTANDFTVEMKLSKSMWAYYNFEQNKAGSTEPKMGFDAYIKKSITEKVNSVPHVLKKETCKVAHINFGYRNGDLIRLLQDRGTCVGQANFKGIPPIEDKINELLKNDIDRLKEPVTCFITFTTQEGYERCNNFLFKTTTEGLPNDKRMKYHLLGQEPLIQDAPSSTNIIWENLEVSEKVRSFKKARVGAIITIFLILMFLLFTALKSRSGRNAIKYYTAKGQCEQLESQFTD